MYNFIQSCWIYVGINIVLLKTRIAEQKYGSSDLSCIDAQFFVH